MSMNGNGRYGITHRYNHLDYYRLPSRAVTEKKIQRCLLAAKQARKRKDTEAMIRLNKRYQFLLDELRRSI